MLKGFCADETERRSKEQIELFRMANKTFAEESDFLFKKLFSQKLTEETQMYMVQELNNLEPKQAHKVLSNLYEAKTLPLKVIKCLINYVAEPKPIRIAEINAYHIRHRTHSQKQPEQEIERSSLLPEDLALKAVLKHGKNQPEVGRFLQFRKTRKLTTKAKKQRQKLSPFTSPDEEYSQLLLERAAIEFEKETSSHQHRFPKEQKQMGSWHFSQNPAPTWSETITTSESIRTRPVASQVLEYYQIAMQRNVSTSTNFIKNPKKRRRNLLNLAIHAIDNEELQLFIAEHATDSTMVSGSPIGWDATQILLNVVNLRPKPLIRMIELFSKTPTNGFSIQELNNLFHLKKTMSFEKLPIEFSLALIDSLKYRRVRSFDRMEINSNHAELCAAMKLIKDQGIQSSVAQRRRLEKKLKELLLNSSPPLRLIACLLFIEFGTSSSKTLMEVERTLSQHSGLRKRFLELMRNSPAFYRIRGTPEYFAFILRFGTLLFESPHPTDTNFKNVSFLNHLIMSAKIPPALFYQQLIQVLFDDVQHNPILHLRRASLTLLSELIGHTAIGYRDHLVDFKPAMFLKEQKNIVKYLASRSACDFGLDVFTWQGIQTNLGGPYFSREKKIRNAEEQSFENSEHLPYFEQNKKTALDGGVPETVKQQIGSKIETLSESTQNQKSHKEKHIQQNWAVHFLKSAAEVITFPFRFAFTYLSSFWKCIVAAWDLTRCPDFLK